MRSEFTKGLLAVAVISLTVVVMAAGAHWGQSPAHPSGQETKKRNLKDQVLTVIDAASDEADVEKKAARTKKTSDSISLRELMG
jgi:predicted nucleic acid-binding Zn ribbon protein